MGYQNTSSPPAKTAFTQFVSMLSSHRFLAASLSLFNGWVFAMSWSGVFNVPFTTRSADFAEHTFWLVSLAVCTLVLSLFFLIPVLRRKASLAGLTISACSMAASAAFIGLTHALPTFEASFFWAGGVASGIGSGIMTAYWGTLISRYDSGVVLQFTTFSLVMSAFITLFISLVPPQIAFVCMMAIPCAAAYAFWRAIGLSSGVDERGARPFNAGKPSSKFRSSHLTVFMGLVVILGMSAGLLRNLTEVDGQASQSAWVFVAATLCASAMLVLSKIPDDGESFALFYRAIAFIAVAFIVLALAVPQTGEFASPALALHTVGFMYFYGLLWVFCVVYTHHHADSTRVFVGGFLANQIGQIVGVLAGGWLRLTLGQEFTVSPASNAMIYLLLFATIVLLARLSSIPKARESMANEASITRACKQAASRFGLTPRESEILIYLVKGYNRAFIAHSLCVSTETVKTHTQHIYTKLDAHSRLEVFNAVAQCLEDDRKMN
ncbi:LuxR family transcriptional regulator [Rubneribacter badeniensis]|uniref:Helix-turn-helix transcriptional regulator n=2 Tax=Eggerthellaceae TaxID=1643826 RepID=A0A2K2U6U6_9ACTN|nr:helix-turn-helix transcriptional regulator [Rubneribacter badeniensis]OUO90157.1 hypothetical protein B5F40_07950 [Gordonibacter sp. An230]OUO96525.1 hypothetical protein B5F41_01825 [Gordonibacter sp. An232A]PNV65989.1 LuxR family transcriptional regulator [Rubneribacter badeniensis]HJH43859.1 helix-turn-helix transcriptional regulator [Rubneribacter badeniensis]